MCDHFPTPRPRPFVCAHVTRTWTCACAILRPNTISRYSRQAATGCNKSATSSTSPLHFCCSVRLHQAATSALHHRPGRPATGRNSRQVKTYYIDIIQLRYPFADSVCCVCNVCLCFALFINRDAPNSSKDIYIYIYDSWQTPVTYRQSK